MLPILIFSSQCEGNLYDNCIFSKFIIKSKCLVFQFLTCGIHKKRRPSQAEGQSRGKSVAGEEVIERLKIGCF